MFEHQQYCVAFNKAGRFSKVGVTWAELSSEVGPTYSWFCLILFNCPVPSCLGRVKCPEPVMMVQTAESYYTVNSPLVAHYIQVVYGKTNNS